jgi:PHD/YefM family antitoxin component YafN of YafNO toxin-antitoxin module
MKTYTYSQARQRLAALLDRARREGRVLIRRKDGEVFEAERDNGFETLPARV